jgi:hypothetical protein
VVIADGASVGAIGMAWAAVANPNIPTAAAMVARSFIVLSVSWTAPSMHDADERALKSIVSASRLQQTHWRA